MNISHIFTLGSLSIQDGRSKLGPLLRSAGWSENGAQKRGPITKIMPSDGCKGDTAPLALGLWYDFQGFGWHLGNVGREQDDFMSDERHKTIDDDILIRPATAEDLSAILALLVDATDKHDSVDDTPAGGGPGMVMRADVFATAIDHAKSENPNAPLNYLSLSDINHICRVCRLGRS